MNAVLKAALVAFLRLTAAERLGAAVGRLTGAAVCVILAGICALAAFACAIAALWIAILPAVGPAYASLFAGGALLTLCFVALAVARFLLTKRRAHTRSPAIDPLLAEVTRLLQEHPGTALLAALVAGLALGSKRRDS